MLRLRELRKSCGLSQKELSDVFDVSTSTISLYENGEREPNLETVMKFADYFHVPVDYLIGRDSAAPYSESFRRNVAFILEKTATADWEAWTNSGGDYDRLIRTVEWDYPIFLEDACEIADELGESMDDLIKDPDASETNQFPGENEDTPRNDRERELIRLLRNADEVHQRLAVEILRAAVRNG